MKWTYWRMPDGTIAVSAGEARTMPDKLYVSDTPPASSADGLPSVPLTCATCTYADSCWQFEERIAAGRPCDVWEPY